MHSVFRNAQHIVKCAFQFYRRDNETLLRPGYLFAFTTHRSA